MKNIVLILFALSFFYSIHANCQTESCDTLYEYPDRNATFKENGTDVLNFFNDNILGLIYDFDSDDFPPTSFKMILIINERDEVESIHEIRGYFSEEIKNKILQRLREEDGWKSGEINGQKVCSKFYFSIGCILWN